MHSNLSRRDFLALSAALSSLAAAPARAADYPSKAIRLIVPLPPGGGADLVARLVAERLAPRLGQQVVVDNRPGGGTVIGAEAAARAEPDGHTLLLGTATTHAINKSLVKKLPYDPVKDFEPISLVAVLPLVLVMHPSVPANSLQELLALARQQPGKINFASTGNGSSIHLAGEMLNMAGGVKMMHVPYKGASPAMVDLLGGRVQFMFSTIPPVQQHVRNGKLKALCVANARRTPLLPELPTTAEAGAPGVEASSWNGLLAPAGTPAAVINRLNTEVVSVMRQPEVAERLRTEGVDPLFNSPSEFRRFMEAETERYAQVIKSINVSVD